MKSATDRKPISSLIFRTPIELFNTMSGREKIFLALLLVFLFDYSFPSVFYFYGKRNVSGWLLQENGIYESLGAIVCLVGCVFLTAGYFKYDVGNNFGLFRTKRNIFFLLLAIFLLFVAGEEVSWGQKLFGFRAPDLISSVNFQKELNIHNLKIIQESNNALAMSACRLLLAYLILLPMALFTFPTFGKFFTLVRVPVATVPVSLLALTNYFISVFLNSFEIFRNWTHDGLSEVFETNLEIILLVFALEIYFSAKKEVGRTTAEENVRE